MHDEIREILKRYQDICMEQLELETLSVPEHTYSKKFYRKMKRLVWSRKHFGKDIKVGYAVRRIAIIVIIIISLFTANEVSAYVWGIDVWNIIRSMVDDGRGEKAEFRKSEERSGNHGEEEIPKPKYDEPQYIPEGYKLSYSDKVGTNIIVEWENNSGEILRYSRDRIMEKMDILYNAEEKFKKRVITNTVEVEIHYYNNEIVFLWYDSVYAYRIDSSIIEEAKIIKMIESIYQSDSKKTVK